MFEENSHNFWPGVYEQTRFRKIRVKDEFKMDILYSNSIMVTHINSSPPGQNDRNLAKRYFQMHFSE